MIRKLIIVATIIMASNAVPVHSRDITLYWVHTSDVHGSIFSYDYLRNKNTLGGLPSVYNYVSSLRRRFPGQVVLTDGGDVLQGQPTSYYYNFIKRDAPHLVASAMNELEYDAMAIGNHDIETGHDVYDRFIAQSKAPVLGANVIDERTGQCYLKPYTIVERCGVRIAILGMTSPAIPNWLPRLLWKDLYFQEMVSCARTWVNYIRENENPDLLVGLFHSGFDGGMEFPEYRENASAQVAREVPGFDLICYGHDHNPRIERVANVEGDTVLCMGTQDSASKIAVAKIYLNLDENNKISRKRIWADAVPMIGSQTPDAITFEALYTDERRELMEWVEDSIGELKVDLLERDAFFGPSLFMSIIHQMQLELTGADISFAAPVSFDSRIYSGTLTIRDMFSLYKYENFLYTIRMTGQEILDYMEMDYGMWTNQMTGPDDHIMLLDPNNTNPRRHGLKNLSYNMDSAAGIIYDVDVSKPEGQRIHIYRLKDGSCFDPAKWYTVAVNSYRGNGGGELLTKGAGIPRDSIASRLISSTDKDLRFYLMKRIIEQGVIRPILMHNWRFVPVDWAKPALQRDRLLIFPDEE